jgi:hypothetical protein
MVLLAVVGTQEEVVATGSDTFSLFAVLVYSVSVVVASRRLFIWPVQCILDSPETHASRNA